MTATVIDKIKILASVINKHYSYAVAEHRHRGGSCPMCNDSIHIAGCAACRGEYRAKVSPAEGLRRISVARSAIRNRHISRVDRIRMGQITKNK